MELSFLLLILCCTFPLVGFIFRSNAILKFLAVGRCFKHDLISDIHFGNSFPKFTVLLFILIAAYTTEESNHFSDV